MRIESADVPEFGTSVNWGMCRNPMCESFGIPFEGEIPDGHKQASDERYHLRIVIGSRDRRGGVIQGRYCGQSAQLHSNRAVRPIVRYFLSLSLPFADCPNPDCGIHVVDLQAALAGTDRIRQPNPARRKPLFNRGVRPQSETTIRFIQSSVARSPMPDPWRMYSGSDRHNQRSGFTISLRQTRSMQVRDRLSRSVSRRAFWPRLSVVIRRSVPRLEEKIRESDALASGKSPAGRNEARGARGEGPRGGGFRPMERSVGTVAS